MWTDLYRHIHDLQTTNSTELALLINPNIKQLPLPIQRHDEPLLPYAKALVTATHDLVCAYILDFASFMSTGAAGAIALERTIRFIGDGHPRILHGPFTGIHYTDMADVTGFGVDAVTVTRAGDVQHYLTHPPYSAFFMEDDITQRIKRGGIYSPEQHRIALYEPDQPRIMVSVTPDSFLRQYLSDDFDQQIRLALQESKDTAHD